MTQQLKAAEPNQIAPSVSSSRPCYGEDNGGDDLPIDWEADAAELEGDFEMHSPSKGEPGYRQPMEDAWDWIRSTHGDDVRGIAFDGDDLALAFDAGTRAAPLAGEVGGGLGASLRDTQPGAEGAVVGLNELAERIRLAEVYDFGDCRPELGVLLLNVAEALEREARLKPVVLDCIERVADGSMTTEEATAIAKGGDL